jgi:hypothetical protein
MALVVQREFGVVVVTVQVKGSLGMMLAMVTVSQIFVLGKVLLHDI